MLKSLVIAGCFREELFGRDAHTDADLLRRLDLCLGSSLGLVVLAHIQLPSMGPVSTKAAVTHGKTWVNIEHGRLSVSFIRCASLLVEWVLDQTSRDELFVLIWNFL